MIENIPDTALQVLLVVVAILTVVGSFMQTTSVRKEWSEKSKTLTATQRSLDEKVKAQDKKIENITLKLVDYASKTYVDNKLDNFDIIATERYNSLKEDQHNMQNTLTGIEQLLTDERTRELKAQADQILELQRQLKEK